MTEAVAHHHLAALESGRTENTSVATRNRVKKALCLNIGVRPPTLFACYRVVAWEEAVQV